MKERGTSLVEVLAGLVALSSLVFAVTYEEPNDSVMSREILKEQIDRFQATAALSAGDTFTETVHRLNRDFQVRVDISDSENIMISVARFN